MAVQVGGRGDVDEDLGIRHPQRHQRKQALAPGQHPGRVRVLGEHRDGVLDALGAVVGEGRQLHGIRPCSAPTVHRSVQYLELFSISNTVRILEQVCKPPLGRVKDGRPAPADVLTRSSDTRSMGP